jgi:import inner membrane translocase subunit TIM9
MASLLQGLQNDPQMERFMNEAQAKDSIRMYNGLVERCFHACANNFTTSTLDSKEELCMYRCTDKYLRYTTRVGRAFQEANMAQQQR